MPASHTSLCPIILAEDSDDDALILLRLLERAHVANPVVRCRHGREVIGKLLEFWTIRPAAEWPLLLLLDNDMPEMNGFAVLRWLRKRPSTRGLRTVIVSGGDDPDAIELAKALGAAGYLIKYPAAECLAAIVKSAYGSPVEAAPTAAAPARDIPPATFAHLPSGPARGAFA